MERVVTEEMPSIKAHARLEQMRDSLPRTLPTEQAAEALSRQPQTLRRWASRGDGPIKPIRILGRLHWRVDDIQRLLAPAEG